MEDNKNEIKKENEWQLSLTTYTKKYGCNLASCDLRMSRRAKRFPHTWQANCLSTPHSYRMWRIRVQGSEYERWQRGHLNDCWEDSPIDVDGSPASISKSIFFKSAYAAEINKIICSGCRILLFFALVLLNNLLFLHL